jgi:hypothetical protein
MEFTFAVSEQGDYAIETLHARLAYDLLLGRFPNGRPLSLHDRHVQGRRQVELHDFQCQFEQRPWQYSEVDPGSRTKR